MLSDMYVISVCVFILLIFLLLWPEGNDDVHHNFMSDYLV